MYSGHLSCKEAETFLKADLRILAEELALAYALKRDAQIGAWEIAVKHAEQVSIWYSGIEKLTGIEQTLTVLAFQMTRREKQTGLTWVDIPLLNHAVDKALDIEPRCYLSRHSSKFGDFQRAMVELQMAWGEELVGELA